MKKILFLHMPKCAGSSITSALESAYEGQVHRESDNLFSVPFEERIIVEGEKPVSDGLTVGHFFPATYRIDSDVFLATFLRNPVYRLASHYSFWNNGGNFSDHYLWRKMKSNEWTFRDFALCPEMQNFYCQYLSGLDVSRFDFIGKFENINECWSDLSRALGLPKTDLSLTNSSGSSHIIETIDDDLYSEIAEFHSKDFDLWTQPK